MIWQNTTVKNISWAASLRFFIRFLTLVRIAILARVLSKAQFGLFGIATLVLSLLEIITETGINVFLIQEENETKYLNTAWVISIIRGILISLLIVLTSGMVSSFFHSPGARQLLLLIALVPFIRGFINPACIRFQKNLQFNKEFVYKLTIVIIETLAVIVLALTTRSTESFIWALIISAVVEVLLSFLLISPHPHAELNIPKAKLILSQGKWVTGFGLLDYLYTNGDNIVVGRMLGQSALGLYQNAYKLSALPMTELVGIYYTVTFPSFSKIAHEKKLLNRIALRNAIGLAALLLIVSLLVYFLAGPLVIIGLGSSWSEAIPIVRILAFLGVLRGIAYGFNSLFMAQKRQKYVTFITLSCAVGLLTTIVPMVSRFGLTGAAYSAIVGSVCAIPPALYFYYRTIKDFK